MAKGEKTAWLAVLLSGFLDPSTFHAAYQVRKMQAKTKVAPVIRILRGIKSATDKAASAKAASDKASQKRKFNSTAGTGQRATKGSKIDGESVPGRDRGRVDYAKLAGKKSVE
jgi:hypothetical protein